MPQATRGSPTSVSASDFTQTSSASLVRANAQGAKNQGRWAVLGDYVPLLPPRTVRSLRDLLYDQQLRSRSQCIACLRSVVLDNTHSLADSVSRLGVCHRGHWILFSPTHMSCKGQTDVQRTNLRRGRSNAVNVLVDLSIGCLQDVILDS